MSDCRWRLICSSDMVDVAVVGAMVSVFLDMFSCG